MQLCKPSKSGDPPSWPSVAVLRLLSHRPVVGQWRHPGDPAGMRWWDLSSRCDSCRLPLPPFGVAHIILRVSGRVHSVWLLWVKKKKRPPCPQKKKKKTKPLKYRWEFVVETDKIRSWVFPLFFLYLTPVWIISVKCFRSEKGDAWGTQGPNFGIPLEGSFGNYKLECWEKPWIPEPLLPSLYSFCLTALSVSRSIWGRFSDNKAVLSQCRRYWKP